MDKKPIDLAKDLLKHLKENPSSTDELSKAKTIDASKPESPKPGMKKKDMDASKPEAPKPAKEIIKEELKSEWKPKFYKCGQMAPGMKKKDMDASKPASPKVAKGESKHDRCVEHVEENSPDVKNPHAVCVAEGVRPAKWKKSENSEVIKEDLKKNWEPKFKKNMPSSADTSMGDQNATAMKAEAGPSPKPAFMLRRLKPSQATSFAAQGMGMPKPSMSDRAASKKPTFKNPAIKIK